MVLILYIYAYMTEKTFLPIKVTNISTHIFVLDCFSVVLKASMRKEPACSESDRPAVP